MRLIALLLLCTLGSRAEAQVVRFRPNLTIPGTMTIGASPGTVTFPLAKASVTAGNSAITISSSWLLGLAATINLYAYFTSTSALTTGPDVIPSANVLGQCPTGSPMSFTAFSQTGPFATGSSLLIYTTSALLSIGGARTDYLSLEIDLTALPQQPAGTYTGTLNLQAQAF